MNFKDLARDHQSQYREKLGEPAGVGPWRTSTTTVSSMLQNGETTGKNFILKKTHLYALDRVKNKKRYETIDSYRLFNNMLSSMPMCFNLFHPLSMILLEESRIVNIIFDKLFPALHIAKVKSIRIEYIPENYQAYINDKTAFDAIVEYVNSNIEKGIIGIEVKYTEGLGTNKATIDTGIKLKVANESGIFNKEGLNQVKNNATQGIRNILLTEAVRLIDGYHHSTSVVLAPEGNISASHEVMELTKLLKQDASGKLMWISLEDMVKVIQENCPQGFENWINEFKNRYLF